MHSSIGPGEEARELYVVQSRLSERLESDRRGPVVLYDIGMGIAANAIAAIDCFLEEERARGLHIVSFETDLSGLEKAQSRAALFPFLKKHEAAVKKLLNDGVWEHPTSKIRWELRKGDFRKSLSDVPAPELIYFDLYSPAAGGDLWGMDGFSKLRKACSPETQNGNETLLFTYSVSTAARAALLLSGFHVGRGVPTLVKQETTVASTRLEFLGDPLGLEWLERFKRSSQPLPADYPGDFEQALNAIRNLPQFTSCRS